MFNFFEQHNLGLLYLSTTCNLHALGWSCIIHNVNLTFALLSIIKSTSQKPKSIHKFLRMTHSRVVLWKVYTKYGKILLIGSPMWDSTFVLCFFTTTLQKTCWWAMQLLAESAQVTKLFLVQFRTDKREGNFLCLLFLCYESCPLLFQGTTEIKKLAEYIWYCFCTVEPVLSGTV